MAPTKRIFAKRADLLALSKAAQTKLLTTTNRADEFRQRDENAKVWIDTHNVNDACVERATETGLTWHWIPLCTSDIPDALCPCTICKWPSIFYPIIGLLTDAEREVREDDDEDEVMHVDFHACGAFLTQEAYKNAEADHDAANEDQANYEHVIHEKVGIFIDWSAEPINIGEMGKLVMPFLLKQQQQRV
jgi:hypothetical protein